MARLRSRFLIDAALAAAAFGGTLLLFTHGLGSDGSSFRRLDALGVLFAAAASVPLLAWRRGPTAVFAACTAASAVAMGLGYAGGPPLGATIALYLLATSRDRRHPWTRRTTAVVVGLFAVHFAVYGIGHDTVPSAELAIGALVWAVAWFAGDRTRLRRAEVAELRQRAILAEQAAQRERRLAAAEERARIARDLHDSAGHAINVIAVHAGAARLLQERDPDGSRAALETIERVAAQTAGEIDQIVRGLREDDERSGGVETPPGLASLDALVGQHATAGTTVTVARGGHDRKLAGALDQAAYRILQEALTNAARHGTGSARVDLRYGERALELTVANRVSANGSPRDAGGGHGLVGMRERSAMLGGELDARRIDGSFVVHARLPYRAS